MMKMCGGRGKANKTRQNDKLCHRKKYKDLCNVCNKPNIFMIKKYEIKIQQKK